jgi:oligopeptide transport system ATP-binding protein
MSSAHLLVVDDLRVAFRAEQGLVHAVNGVSFHVDRSETLAVVGESGSGKSVTMLSLLGLLPPARTMSAVGRAALHVGDTSIDLADPRAVAAAHVCGRRIGYVAQDPSTSLNPTVTVGAQIVDMLRHHRGDRRSAARARAVDLLGRVGIPDPHRRVDAYPHELSGGMRQRAMIAIAISCEPALLIADEPTTALDVTVQAQIVDLVRELRDELRMAVVWITHDLGVVAELADRVAVMYGGRIVESASVTALFDAPTHPYTQGLLAAVPRLGARRDRLASIPGQPPELRSEPIGCSFAPRCPHAFEPCHTRTPPDIALGPTRSVACWWDTSNQRPRAEVAT